VFIWSVFSILLFLLVSCLCKKYSLRCFIHVEAKSKTDKHKEKLLLTWTIEVPHSNLIRETECPDSSSSLTSSVPADTHWDSVLN